MGSEVAPEFIFDQGIYYPVAPDCYGFYCTGNEKPVEWDDHHSFLGLDGQDIRYSGLQTESLPYVYYTPNYGYSHSSYNPYNPYIPGAVVDFDGTNLGVQQYFTNQSYPHPISSPSYMPVVVPPNADMVPYPPADPSFLGMVPSFAGSNDNVGLAFTSSLASGMKPLAPLTTVNPSLEFSKFAPSIISDEPVVNQRKQSTIHGAMQAGILPQTIENGHTTGLLQSTSFSRGRVQPSQNSLKANLAAKNNYANYGPTLTPAEKLNLSYGGRFRSSNLPNDVNRGPRTTRAKDQGASITAKSYTSKLDRGSLYKNIIINPDHYDGTNFRVDYPNAKFFVIKSYSEDDVHKSIKYNVWSSTPNGNKKLDCAYIDAQNLSGGEREKCPIFLFFSVNASGHFCGVAEMIGRVDFEHDMDFWQQDQWSGSFPIKWHIIKDVANSSLRHITLENNEDRPVTHSRDTQEIAYAPGVTLLNIFKNSPLKESILDDFMYYEELEMRKHQEKVKLPRRNYDSADLIPTFVPANILGSRIMQPMPSNKIKPNSVPTHLSGDYANQLNGSLPEANKSDQVGSVGQYLELDMTQKTYGFTQVLNQNKQQLLGEVKQAVQDWKESDNKIIKSDSQVGQSLDVVAALENCKISLPLQSHVQQLRNEVFQSSASNKNQQSAVRPHRNVDEKQTNRAVSKSQKSQSKAYRPVQRNDVKSISNVAVLSPPSGDGKGTAEFGLSGKTSEKRNNIVNTSNLMDTISSAAGSHKSEKGNLVVHAPELQDNAKTDPSRNILAKPIARNSGAGLNNSTPDTVTIGLVQINVNGIDECSGTSGMKRFQMDQGETLEKKN